MQENVNKETLDLVDLDKVAQNCSVNPYFIVDIASGDMLAIFSVNNDMTAIRSFTMSCDSMPLNLVKDVILVKYDSKEVIFEGKNYLDKWKENQSFIASLKNKGVVNEN